MCGGTIVQIVDVGADNMYIEVLENTSFDRQWRLLHLDGVVPPKVGDSIWWQSRVAYLSRGNEFTDVCIGRCFASDPPLSGKKYQPN